jgi:hypothetical protein
VCVLLGVWSGAAGAVPVFIDFNGLSIPSQFPTYASTGVTFSALGGGDLQAVLTPNGTAGITSTLVGIDPPVFPPMQAVIASEAVNVYLGLGDINNDAETLFIDAYDASDNLLDFDEFATDIGDASLRTLSVSAPSEGPYISYVIFGATGGLDGSSVVADNFVYCSPTCPSVIPAPGAILLTMMGTGLVGHLRRRGAF